MDPLLAMAGAIAQAALLSAWAPQLPGFRKAPRWAPFAAAMAVAVTFLLAAFLGVGKLDPLSPRDGGPLFALATGMGLGFAMRQYGRLPSVDEPAVAAWTGVFAYAVIALWPSYPVIAGASALVGLVLGGLVLASVLRPDPLSHAGKKRAYLWVAFVGAWLPVVSIFTGEILYQDLVRHGAFVSFFLGAAFAYAAAQACVAITFLLKEPKTGGPREKDLLPSLVHDHQAHPFLLLGVLGLTTGFLVANRLAAIVPEPLAVALVLALASAPGLVRERPRP